MMSFSVPMYRYMFKNIQEMFAYKFKANDVDHLVLRRDTSEIYQVVDTQPRFQRIEQPLDSNRGLF
jgi:hypothetical protein